jgi:hypothetical protein
VDAHFGAGVFAGLTACKRSACNEQSQYDSDIFLHLFNGFSKCKNTTFSRIGKKNFAAGRQKNCGFMATAHNKTRQTPLLKALWINLAMHWATTLATN